MPAGDFFAFCTSLRPLELKAIGALSQVRHIPEHETIYVPGDASDTLYIINRGLLEVVQQTGKATITGAGTYLSRGDVFGDLEALADLPRRHTVRTCEAASLQCFHRKDFPELVRRVPAFFRYLSESLAARLVRAHDAVPCQSNCLELSGNLANFDLVTVYQTIVNSSKTGELSIRNEGGELISAFFFECGQTQIRTVPAPHRGRGVLSALPRRRAARDLLVLVRQTGSQLPGAERRDEARRGRPPHRRAAIPRRID